MQGGNRVHDALAASRINILFRAEIGFTETNWLANHDRNWSKQSDSATDGPGVECPEDPQRDHGCQGFGDDQANSGLRRLQISIRRTGAFGKNERAIALSNKSNQNLERAPIDSFLINRDHVDLRQQPPQQWGIEQASPRQKIDGPIAGDPGERRVEKTLMVHGQNNRAALNHPLGMQYADLKKDPRDQPRQIVPEPVIEIHDPGSIRCTRPRPPIL